MQEYTSTSQMFAIDSKYNPFMIRIPIHTKVSKTDPFCKGIHILGDN